MNIFKNKFYNILFKIYNKLILLLYLSAKQFIYLFANYE